MMLMLAGVVPVGAGATGVLVDPPPQLQQVATTIIDPAVRNVDRIVVPLKNSDNAPGSKAHAHRADEVAAPHELPISRAYTTQVVTGRVTTFKS